MLMRLVGVQPNKDLLFEFSTYLYDTKMPLERPLCN